MPLSRMKNFGKLFIGNFLGQLVAFVLYPYISRYYSPEEFARFGFMVSLTTVLGVFATGQLHTALLNPETEDEADSLVGLSTVFVLFASVATFVFFLIYDSALLPVAIYLLFYSLFEIEKMVFIRRKAYGASAATQITFRILGNGGKLVPALVSLNAYGLVFSEVISLVFVVCYGIKKSVFKLKFPRGILKKYIKFPLFQTTIMASNIFINDFPILFWIALYGKEDVGYFVMGQKLIILPAMVVSLALQNATVHHLIQSKNPRGHFLGLCSLMLLSGTIGVLLVHWVGEEVFSLVLGQEWKEGIEIFKLLSYLVLSKLIFAFSQATFVLKSETTLPFILRLMQLFALYILSTAGLSFYESLKLYIIIDIICEFMLMGIAGFKLRPPFVFRKTVKEVGEL